MKRPYLIPSYKSKHFIGFEADLELSRNIEQQALVEASSKARVIRRILREYFKLKP